MAHKIYEFSKYWRPAALASLAACTVSLLLVFVPGPNYGIDFAGGTNIIARFSEQVPDGDVRTALADVGLTDASVVRFGEDEEAGHFQFLIQTGAVTAIGEEARTALAEAVAAEFGEGALVEYDDASGDRVYVRVPEAAYTAEAATLPAEDGAAEGAALFARLEEPIAARVEEALAVAGFADASAQMYGNPSSRRFQASVHTLQFEVAEHLATTFGDRFVQIDRVETVGPRVGAQLRADAVKSILFALVGILLYIAVRFDLRYAPGAVISLAHDVLITLGIFIVIREEINLPILAAFLTIVGYSLNDTIVNFDRTRENLQLAESRADLVRIVDKSVSECLSRTFLTSGTTLIAVICIYILGGGLVRSFALAMGIGIVVGTYSTIYIASPLMVWMSRYMDTQAKAQAERTATVR